MFRLSRILSIAMLGTIAVVSACKNLRGARPRELLGITCTIQIEDSLYAPTEEYPDGTEEMGFLCEFSEEDAKRFGWSYAEIIDASQSLQEDSIISGATVLTASHAIFDDRKGSPRLFLPIQSSLELLPTERNLRFSPNFKTTGSFQTIVFRVVDSTGRGPTLTLGDLEEELFGPGNTLKTQINNCSYGKARIEPFVDSGIPNGVVDLHVDLDLNHDESFGKLKEASRKAAKERFGDRWKDIFDVIIFVMPLGSDDRRSAVATNKIVDFKDGAAGHIFYQMHEVGHVLGLSNSGVENRKHKDRQGYMGGTQKFPINRRCYNPAKSYQLLWYSDQTATIEAGQRKKFTLNGVTDYGKDQNALIVLRLHQTEGSKEDYYIGYNRKTGINRNTPEEDGDKVIIVRKLGDSGPFTKTPSIKVAQLLPGESHTIESFNGEPDRAVTVDFVSRSKADAVVEIHENLGWSSCEDAKTKKFYWQEEARKISCSQVASRGHCDRSRSPKGRKYKSSKPLWQLCAASCKRCGDL